MFAALKSLSPEYPHLDASEIRSAELKRNLPKRNRLRSSCLAAGHTLRGLGEAAGLRPEIRGCAPPPGEASSHRQLRSIGNCVFDCQVSALHRRRAREKAEDPKHYRCPDPARGRQWCGGQRRIFAFARTRVLPPRKLELISANTERNRSSRG